MAVSPEYADFLLEQFAPLGDVSLRRMFGGAGIFCDGLMIALIAGEELYLKTDEDSCAAFEEEGCEPFTFRTKEGKSAIMSYHRAPDRLMDEPDEFIDWARAAFDAALRADRAKSKPKKKSVKKKSR